jgi:hypothetical protein
LPFFTHLNCEPFTTTTSPDFLQLAPALTTASALTSGKRTSAITGTRSLSFCFMSYISAP